MKSAYSNLFASIVLSLSFTSCSSSDNGTFTIKGSSTGSGAASTLRYKDFASTTPTGTPTSLKVTLFKAYISTNQDCSDPILVQDLGESGQEFDFLDSPTLFSGSIPAGTYNCLILVLNDTMRFKADQTAVNAHNGCNSTTDYYTFDVYRAGEDDSNLWIDKDGNTITSTGSAASPGTDKMTVFLTTAADASVIKASNGATPHEYQRTTLTAGLTVPGQVTYYWNATDGIADHSESGTDYCWLEEVTSGFR